MADIDAPVLGFLTEPLPRADREPHANYDYNLAELRRLDAATSTAWSCADANSWDGRGSDRAGLAGNAVAGRRPLLPHADARRAGRPGSCSSATRRCIASRR